MAKYLGIEEGIEHNEYHGSHGYGNNIKHLIDICDERYDKLRATIMPYAYELSTWLQEYLIPVAQNESRPDVKLAQPQLFIDLVEEYKKDPCDRLIRLNNGTYSHLADVSDLKSARL
mmetsp:Transcript_4769/g.4500  ORF Transcript_4769/g.4500 Transcript_4769/m.4500 type:complete len:117 (-) Transcript_4769:193-543(-)